MATSNSMPMFDPSGQLRWIPTDKLDAAAKAGGQQAVRIVDPRGIERWVPQPMAQQAIAAGARFAAPGAALRAIDARNKAQQPSGLARFLTSAVAPVKGAVESFSGNPTEEEKKAGLTSLYDTALRPLERVVEAQTGQVDQARDLAKQGRYSEAAGHAVASALPLVGPWVAEATREYYRQLEEGDVAGALGTAAGNASMAVVPEKVVEGAPKVADALRAGGRRTLAAATGTGPRTVGELVRKTTKENEAAAATAAEKNAEATAKAAKKTKADEAEHARQSEEAAHETRGREIGHLQSLRTKAAEIETADAADRARSEHEHQTEVQRVREHNERLNTRHREAAARAEEENRAAEQMRELRRQKEAELQRETDAYRAQEQATDTRGKAAENEAWAAWRSKMKGATVDGAEIAGPLKKLRLDSPEADRTLRQLEPRGDEVPQESPYARLRDQTAQANFGGDYASLSPMKRDAVDAMMVRSGESPEPIDLNPEEGHPISVERVQRASSILQRYIRSGRFEGPLLGEMKQVAKVLRRAVTNASENHGAGEDLDAARAETVRYQEAFGRERPEPRTVRGEREKTANPEEVKRLQEEERLAAARKYDPSLAEAQQRVRAAREELRKIPSEEQLRKSIRQVPRPPSVNDAREGYRLLPEPPAPTPRLTSGTAAERAAQVVEPPARVEPPDRPKPTVAEILQPERKTIGTKDIRQAKSEGLEGRAKWLRHRGMWAASWPVFYALRDILHGNVGAIPGTLAESVATAGAVHTVASLLENPRVADFLTQATPDDVAQVPDELRGDLPAIVQAAQKQGIRVSPALVRATVAAGVGGNQRKRVAAALTGTQ